MTATVIDDAIGQARTILELELSDIEEKITGLDEQLTERRADADRIRQVLEQLGALGPPPPSSTRSPATSAPAKRPPAKSSAAPRRTATGGPTRDQVLEVFRKLDRPTTAAEIATHLDTDDMKTIRNRITSLQSAGRIVKRAAGLYALPTLPSTAGADDAVKPPPSTEPAATPGAVPVGGPIGRTVPFDHQAARARAGGADV